MSVYPTALGAATEPLESREHGADEFVQISRTDILRIELDMRRIPWTAGLTMQGGGRVNEDNVTTAWPLGLGSPEATLTFKEEDGELTCMDVLTIGQCLSMVEVMQ